MKFCENCGIEIGGGDGENLCTACDEAEADTNRRRLARRRQQRKERESALRSCGLVKVRGALGGTYWE